MYVEFSIHVLVICIHQFLSVEAETEKLLLTHPDFQTANENKNIQINCIPIGIKCQIEWGRINGNFSNERTVIRRNRLYINNVHYEDAGFYVCKCRDPDTNKWYSGKALVHVVRRTEPWRFEGNRSQPTTVGYSYTQRTTSIPYVFTGIYSTVSPLDEDALRPKITLLPKLKTEVFCGDEDESKAGVLLLECEFAGHPEPLIKWKKYEGHVPSKCQQSSRAGHGILKCPNFRQADQGAYTCVGENFLKSSESQPRSIAKCSNTIYCKGFKVVNEEQIEHCIECYCSGKSSECEQLPSNLTVAEFSYPETETEVFASEDGNIVFIPSGDDISPSSEVRKSAQEITYCSLIKDDFGETSFLKSYGRNINIPRYTGKVDFLPNAPDLLIRGNGTTLMYKFNMVSYSSSNIKVRFWPGNWHHLNKTSATRKDIMKVLAHLDTILLRCEYKQNENINWGKKVSIFIESSAISESRIGVSYVEKCKCPTGYDGLSCETCATGYKRKVNGTDFVCERESVPKTCPEGYTGQNCEICDTSKSYYSKDKKCVKAFCDPLGSLRPEPNFWGQCTCKVGVTGNSCNQCQPGYFNFQKGCTKCWCSGVTTICNSSTWYRTVISSTSLGGYNSSDGRNFWLLPAVFGGNRLSSYGGYLNYTLKYAPNIPKQQDILTVELLTMDNVTISYTHPHVDSSTFYTEKSWSVILVETFWRKSNNSNVTRNEFLTVLSEVKAVYIESPYHLSSKKVNLTSVRMSSAEPMSDGINEIAVEMEMCVCPVGYTGSSCERCAEGYYKSKEGNQFKCLKCDCEFCDPERGCMDCPSGTYRDNPLTEPEPICQDCPCNGNEINCFKDSYNQIFCNCKSGYMGIHCEKSSSTDNKSYLQVKIAPRVVKSQIVGKKMKFTCSYGSGNEMKIVVKKTRVNAVQQEIDAVVDVSPENCFNTTKSFEVVLENDLKYVECFVLDKEDEEVGHVKAIISDLIVKMEPVKIKNCMSDLIKMVEKEEKDLICEATGSPPLSIQWFRTTETMKMEKVDTFNGVHTITSLKSTLDRNGTIYTCIAENSEGVKDSCSKILLIRRKCDFIYVDPKYVHIQEGEKIQIKCRTTAKNPVGWSRLGSFLPVFRHKVENGILEVFNATLDDSGTYMCKVKTDYETINKTVSVVVSEKTIPPKVSIKENDQKIKVGETIELTCIPSGKPLPKVTWVKNNLYVTNVIINGNKLKIKEATLKNAGIYTCEGVSSIGNDTDYIHISVQENKVKPKVKALPSHIVSTAGEIVNVICRIEEGYPEPALEWMKYQYDEWHSVTETNTISFQQIRTVDSGKYKCVGTNSEGRDESEVTIEVLVPPTVNISADKITSQVNEDVTITCLAFGYPEPVMHWFNAPLGSDAKVLKSDTVLIEPLKSVKQEIRFKVPSGQDEIKIRCSAQNKAGEGEKTALLKILQPAEPETSGESVEFAHLGETFELNFENEGNITVEKVNETLLGDECIVYNSLVIYSVQVQHAGKYIVRSVLKMSTIIKIFTLKVVGFVPKFSQSNKSYMVLPALLNSDKELRLQMSFKTKQGHGLLLQKKNHDLNLYLKHEKLHISFHPKDEPSIEISSSIKIEPFRWYSLAVEISRTYIDVTIYDEQYSVLDRITKFPHKADITFSHAESFVLGGIMPRNSMSSYLHGRLLSNHIPSHFDGCISRLQLDDHEFDLVKESSFTFKTNLCKRCSEEFNPCGENLCFDAPTQKGFICMCPEDNKFTSDCPASCSGKGCETQLDLCKLVNPCKRNDLNRCSNKPYSLQCECHPGYSGTTCEKVIQHSFCTNSKGYMRVPSYLLERHFNKPEKIKIGFTTAKEDGVLLWQGNLTNYLLIAIVRGRIEYVYFNQGVELGVTISNALPIDKKLVVKATRRNETIVLEVSDEWNLLFKSANTSSFTTNRVKGDIYLGGMPPGIRHSRSQNIGLNGCIYYVQFGDKSKINFHDVALEDVGTSQAPSERFPIETDSGNFLEENDKDDEESYEDDNAT